MGNNGGSFSGATINYLAEYHEARRIMGERGTDIDTLIESIGLLYLNCPADLRAAYESLLGEAMRRKTVMELNPPPWRSHCIHRG